VLHGFLHPLHQLSLERHHFYQVRRGWWWLVRLRLAFLGRSLLNLGFRVLGRLWRCSVTSGPSSQSFSTQGWASTATPASTPLLGFFLSSGLLEAGYQPVGAADRHPSENIRKRGKFTHVTHQLTHEYLAIKKIVLSITYTQGEEALRQK
jgi:hypothetical protein